MRNLKDESLSRLIFFGETSLRTAVEFEPDARTAVTPFRFARRQAVSQLPFRAAVVNAVAG